MPKVTSPGHLTAHLLSKSFLSPYGMADPVLGDGDREPAGRGPTLMIRSLSKKRKKEQRQSSCFCFEYSLLQQSHGNKPPPEDQRFQTLQ